MKLLKPLIVAVMFFVALSGGALAEIKLIKQQAIGYENAAMKFASEDGRTYWVSSKLERPTPETRSFFLYLEDFFDGSSPRRVALDSGAPLFMAAGAQNGLLAITKGYENMVWIAIKLNKALNRVEKHGELKSMVAVGTTTKIGDKYYIVGIDKKNQQALLRMNAGLRVERERITTDPKTDGAMGIPFVASGKLHAMVGFMDRSEIWEITPDFVPLKKIKLSGTAFSSIPLKEGGFAVLSQDLKTLDYFVERFNTNGQSIWRKKIYTLSRTGAGTPPVLCELPDGLCLVGGTNNRLLVARISADGERVRITEDTRSGLSVPLNAMAGYLVGVLDNNIHVRGIAQKLGDDHYTSFHFIETP